MRRTLLVPLAVAIALAGALAACAEQATEPLPDEAAYFLSGRNVEVVRRGADRARFEALQERAREQRRRNQAPGGAS